MKNKILKVITVLVLILFLSKGMNSFAMEISDSELLEEEIIVGDNTLNLEFNENSGTINIMNEYFNFSSNFDSYSLNQSAIAENLLILECHDSSYKYIGLDFGTNKLNYILIIEGIKYFSSIDFYNINSTINLWDDESIENVLQSSLLTYEIDLDKYKNLEDSAYTAYICFDILPKNKEIDTKQQRSNSSYTLTGKTEAIDVGQSIVNVIFGSELLTTVGLNYGMKKNDSGDYQYLYIVETELDDFTGKYIAQIKVWDLEYNAVSYEYCSTEKIVRADIKVLYDVLIIGNSTTGQISIATSGSTYVPMKSVSFNLVTTNFTYIDKYKIGYTTKEGAGKPAYLVATDYLLGMFVPYYKAVTTAIEFIDNLDDFKQQIKFNDTMNEFNIASCTNNLRNVGFELSNSDVGSGVFNDRYLHNYSFYQEFRISGVPNYEIDLNMNVQIVPLYYLDSKLSFSWDFGIINNYNCNHNLQYVNHGETMHIVSCDYCSYSYNESHNFFYNNLQELGHEGHCIKCDYSLPVENHTLFLKLDRELCIKCDYTRFLEVYYTSNGDGKTHTKHTNNGMIIENCIGFGSNLDFIFCDKCGQKITNGIGGIIKSNSSVTGEILSLESTSNKLYIEKENDIS